jgi:hypothetical protein
MGSVPRNSFNHSQALPAAMRKTNATKAKATMASKRQIAWPSELGGLNWIGKCGCAVDVFVGAAEEAEFWSAAKVFRFVWIVTAAKQAV